MFYIILFIVLLLGSISLNLFENKEYFTNYVPLKTSIHKYGEPSDEIKKVNVDIVKNELSKQELNIYNNYINDKEILNRKNYNTMTAEQYYKMLFTDPITPMEEESQYIPINENKYKTIGDTNDKILDPKLIEHKPLESHVWHMVNNLDPEDINKMHLPPQYLIPYK
jgi:c-di-AMP phosphodiesterase-like protein